MELEDLAKLVENKHDETQRQIGKLDEKVDALAVNQSVIQSKLKENTTTRVDCLQSQQRCKDEVYAAIRKGSFWNKIGAAIATAAGAVAGFLLLKGKS